MTPETLEEQLTKYLTDVHSIEQQALAQMKVAPRLAGDDEIAQAFAAHLAETEIHEQLIRGRLQARGAGPAHVKDLVGAITGMGFGAFAAAQPDTPGKLVAHAYSYEHMEQVAYRILTTLAERVGDIDTVEVARRIEGEEERMGERLEGLFDRAAAAALRDLPPRELTEQICKYLADAHAIEQQATQLLSKAPDLAGTPMLAAAYEEHLEETRDHSRLVGERLDALGGSPSRIKDAAMRLGALNWGAFFSAQPDTPAKLAGFAYAFEHLEIAGYELLKRVAQRGADPGTVQLADRILVEERAAAERILSHVGEALDASLHEQGLPAR